MPGSWEIMEQRKNRVLLATIIYGGAKVTMPFCRAYKNLILPPDSDTLVVENFPYPQARNQAAKVCLENNYGYLAFLDADVLLQPDAYMKLMETGLPLVSALYYQKFPPYSPACFGASKTPDGKLKKEPITNWTPGQIIPVTFMASGACLIHRSVFERMQQVLGHPRFYSWTLDVGQEGVSEDYWFSLKALEIGIQPYCHTGIIARHELVATAGIEAPQGGIRPSQL